MVWLEGRNLRVDQPSIKLAPKRHGPFPICKVLSPVTYQLTLPGTWKIHDVFHVDLLTPYIETDFHGVNFERPPPDLISGEEEYEVEKVLDSRRHGRRRKVQYLVKWRGYPDSDNEWVDWNDMSADEALDDFRKQNPKAVTHIRRLQSQPISSIPPSLTSWIQDYSLMSNDVVCTTVSEVESSGLYPDAPDNLITPYEAKSDITLCTAAGLGLEYTAAELHQAWHDIHPQVPSTWRTPSNSTSTSRSESPHSDKPFEQRTFLVPQLLIDTRRRSIQDPRALPQSPDPDRTQPPSRASSASPLPIPPRINGMGSLSSDTREPRSGSPILLHHPYPQSKDSASVPTNSRAEASGGHTDTDPCSDGGPHADTLSLWDSYGNPTPPPVGYHVNWGANYVPFFIRDSSGILWPAKYTRVDMNDDPHVSGFRAGSPTPYSERLIAQAQPDLDVLPKYKKPDLEFLVKKSAR